MSGTYGGVQKFIHKKQPLAFYIHCAAHNLNLVVNDAVSGVCEVQDGFSAVQELLHSLATVYTLMGFDGMHNR